MKILLLTLLILAFFDELRGQSVNLVKSDGEVTHLVHLTGEDQHGNEIIIAPPEEKPLLIFFLPKPDSRREAQSIMDEVLTYFERLDNLTGSSVNKVLVIEPYRTGPLVNRIFRSRLSDKPFSVLLDSDGKIVRKAYHEPYTTLAWLINQDGEITYKTLHPFPEREFQIIRNFSNSLTDQKSQP
jgi:hypothetical protein